MIDKNDVSHWLYKCKNRAVEAVNTDIQKYLEKIIDELPDIKKDYNLILEITEQLSVLRKKYGGINRLYFDKGLRYDYYKNGKYFDRYEDIDALILSYLDSNPTELDTRFQELKLLFDKRIKVEREYESLISVVLKKRKVESMIKYLNELGFDTTSLMTMPNHINKDLLFVCHDNKPAEEKE